MSKLHMALLLVVTLTCAIGCRRDNRVEPGPNVPVDGRQKFVGAYDVYDTLGNWRCEMEISLHQGITNIDFVYIKNWGNEFNLFIQHDDGNVSDYLNLTGQFGIQDHEGDRWALFEKYDSLFMNGYLIHDILRMS